MKNILLLILCILPSIYLFGNNYSVGDSLTVVAFNGLSLRTGPGTSHVRSGTISLNEKVIVINTFGFSFYQDTIGKFPGNWVYINSSAGVGFVFDAFLSEFPFVKIDSLIDKNKSSIDMPELLKNYALTILEKEACSLQYYNGSGGEGSHSMKITVLSNNHKIISHSYWEGYSTEMELFNPRPSEVYYLVMNLVRQLPGEAHEINEYLLIDPLSRRTYECVLDSGSDCVITVFRKGPDQIAIFFNFPCC